MENTLIQIKKETAKSLRELKKYNRQSYDEVIKKLINESKEEGLTEKEKKDIEEALLDVKQGRVYKIEDVAKGFGVKLRN